MDASKRLHGIELVPLGELLPKEVAKSSESLLHMVWEELFAVDGDNNLFRDDDRSSPISQARLIEELVCKAYDTFGEDGHMMCMGYRVAGRGNFETKISGGMLESKFPNWIVSYLKSNSWEELLKIIGAKNMRRILWDIPVIYIRRGESLVQLTGASMFEGAYTMSLNSKRRKTDESFIRLPLFVTKKGSARSARNWYLPERHPITVAARAPENVMCSASRARALALHISSAVFEQSAVRSSNANSQEAPSDEKKTARTRLPTVWVHNLSKIQQMVDNYHRCSLKSLFGKAKQYIRSLSSNQTENLLLELSNSHVPPNVVSAFLKLALKRIVPKPLWGTSRASRVLLSKLDHHITESCNSEGASWLDISSGLTIADFPCFKSAGRKREAMLALKQWLKFLFQDLAIEILRACFTIVRDEAGTAHYYTQRSWDGILKTEMSLDNKRFEQVPKENLGMVRLSMQRRKFGMALARYVKKRNGGFRLILNMSTPSSPCPIAPNFALRPAFHALTCEVQRNKILSGAFVQGFDAIYEKYRAFIARRNRLLGPADGVRLFAVAVDIRKCFDTMRHDRLLQCVKEALVHAEYATGSRYETFFDAALQTIRTKRMRLSRPSHQDSFATLGSLTADVRLLERSCIVRDTIVRQFVSRDRVLDLVEELVTRTYVALGAHTFKMIEGIPQGSILSNLLCRIYYGAFERDNLSELVDPDRDLLMRMVDDYLLLTPSKEVADRFKEFMSKGNEDWGCFINIDKNREAAFIDDPSWIPWCGLMFDTRNGFVRMRFDGKDNFSPARATRFGIGRSLQNAFAARCRPLLLDLSINSASNVFLNIAQLFALCALRLKVFAAFSKASKSAACAEFTEMESLITFAHALIQTRARYPPGFCSMVDVRCLAWLSYHLAFSSMPGSMICSRVEAQWATFKPLRRFDFEGNRIDWHAIEQSTISTLHVLQ